jgi:hypothetical protein
MRYLLYADRGLVDADVPTLAALREHLRRLVNGQPPGPAGLYVLVFDSADDRYLGRVDVLVEDGEPVLVRPATGPLAGGIVGPV